jgi:prophage maintenance system killer protein
MAPFPDGNKRAAWVCLELFIGLNDGSWNDERPDTDDAVEAMLALVARAGLARELASRTGHLPNLSIGDAAR